MAIYNVTIENGTGYEAMQKGNYTVEAVATGYDATTLDPKSYTVTASAGTGEFTLAATGELTLTFNETGATGGTPITSGTVVMTDSSGTTQYGSVNNIGSDGNAVFSNVPFGTSGQPFTLYFKQLTSDDGHNIEENIITVNMTSSSQSQYVQNAPIALQAFSLKDANYDLPISGTLTFTGE